MFNVSEKYIEAAHQSSRETDIRGQIVLTNGNIVKFTATDLLQGSTTYSNRCLSNDTFNLGSCYIGEFKTTIKTNVDRYALHNATLIVEFLLKVDDGEWETVNVGTFTINSAKRVGNYVEIDSFDNMSLLEKNISAGTSGTAADLLTWICQECHVDNGMTDEMWSNLVNTEYVFAFSELDYTTYRDLLSEIATLTGGFATVDQFGALVIKTFGISSIDTINDRIRTDSKFEDYVCKYTAVSLKVNDIQYHYASENDDGMTVILHDNKLAAANSPEQINTMLYNIVEKIQNIVYIPCDVNLMVNPAYELGDVISFTGYNTDNTTIVSCIHSISWTFRASMNLQSVGENSKIANAKSSTDKAISNIGSSSSQTEIKTLQFTNARAATINGTKKVMIMDASFSATHNETAVPLLSGQFVADIEEQGIYRIIYELNGEEADFKPEEAVHSVGPKIFTFIKSFNNLLTDVSNRLRIYLECSPLTIVTKELQKNSNDEYELIDVEKVYNGKARIEVGNLNAVLQSANLSFAVKWDGNFEISDVYEMPALMTKWIVPRATCDVQINIVESQKIVINEQSRCVHNSPDLINPPMFFNMIFDYDAVPIYDLQFKELLNNSSDSGNLSSSTVVITPDSDVAGCCASYYMQLDENVSTRITLTTDVNTQLYLIDALTEDIYKVGIVAENNVIEYTSTGARFWLLIISESRHDTGAYTITTQQI